MTERPAPSAAPTPPNPGPRRAGRGRIPLPPAVLGRRGGRVLDPSKAGTFRDRPLLPTAYVADQLLVQGGSTSAMEALVDAARATKHAIGTRSEELDAYVERLGDAALGALASRCGCAVCAWPPTATRAPWPTPGRSAPLPRERGRHPAGLHGGPNHLVHLTAPSAGIEGYPLFDVPALVGSPLFDGPPYFAGNPRSTDRATSGGPARPGAGDLARAPARAHRAHDRTATRGRRARHRPRRARLAAAPARRAGRNGRWAGHRPRRRRAGRRADRRARPAAGVARPRRRPRHLHRRHRPPGLPGRPGARPAGHAERRGRRRAPADRRAQHAPRAAGPAQLRRTPDEVVDVVSLSLGYYHEDPDDVAYSSVLAATLRHLGELGVAVVAAAGNDHTSTPMFPAGFAARAGAGRAATRCRWPRSGPSTPRARSRCSPTPATGSAAAAPVPTSSRPSRRPSTAACNPRRPRPTGARRSTPTTSSGFGVWSGTSFAAPVLAGEIAAGPRRAGGP